MITRRSFLGRLAGAIVAAQLAIRLKPADELNLKSKLFPEDEVEWVQTVRRRVVYSYPNGASPFDSLFNLLQKADEQYPELIDSPTFNWWGTRLDT